MIAAVACLACQQARGFAPRCSQGGLKTATRGVAGRSVHASVASSLPSVASSAYLRLPPPLAAAAATGATLFRMLPLPFKLIATILTTLGFLVMVEDFADMVARLRKGKAVVEEVKMVRKPFIPTKSSVAIRFLQTGMDPIEYGAEVGAKLSLVAEDAAIPIQYDCRKGQCGTCSVKVGSKWIKTCQTAVPMPLLPGEVFEVIVPKASIKSSKFFSPRSFLGACARSCSTLIYFQASLSLTLPLCSFLTSCQTVSGTTLSAWSASSAR